MLYVVATPLGNLGDFSERARATLSQASSIYAEDTRHSKKLCTHFGIHVPLLSLHEHNEVDRIDKILAELHAGQSIAIISDAGTPAISDPGARIVDAVHAEGLTVTSIPGASALTAALSVSGFHCGVGVSFLGFLATKGREREEQLEAALKDPRIVVLYEAPHRLQSLLRQLSAAAPMRKLCLCRELTKMYESIRRVDAKDAELLLDEPARGEVTIVLGPLETQANRLHESSVDEDDEQSIGMDAALRRCLKSGLSTRDAAKAVAAILDRPKKQVYSRAVALSKD